MVSRVFGGGTALAIGGSGDGGASRDIPAGLAGEAVRPLDMGGDHVIGTAKVHGGGLARLDVEACLASIAPAAGTGSSRERIEPGEGEMPRGRVGNVDMPLGIRGEVGEIQPEVQGIFRDIGEADAIDVIGDWLA